MANPEDTLKLFAMANQLVEYDLDRIEGDYAIDLRRGYTRALDAEETYYPQIEREFRVEAAEMAPHYEVFYSLEKTIRRLIAESLEEQEGSDWWESGRIKEP